MNKFEEKPLVSVIIPCYNAENTLKQCLDSVLNQQYWNLEVLVIDDGSVDGSRAILQYYTQKDERVRLLTSTHQGVSHARNLGLFQARGKYLQFVDADDYLLEDCTGFLVNGIQSQKADWVICDYLQRKETRNRLEPESRQQLENPSQFDACTKEEHVHLAGGLYKKRDFLKKLLRYPHAHYYGVLWNKLYRKQIIHEAKLRFSQEVSMGEDFIFNMEYLSLVHNIICLEEPLYVYCWQRKDSLSNRYKKESERIAEQVRMYYAYKKMFIREKLYIPWRYGILYYVVKAYFDELEALGDKASSYKEMLYEEYIRKNHIYKPEFIVYSFLKKAKQVVESWKR